MKGGTGIEDLRCINHPVMAGIERSDDGRQRTVMFATTGIFRLTGP